MKKSFLLYFDLCEVFNELTDEQAGQLIKEIINYSNSLTQTNPPKPIGLSGLLRALFSPFKNHIDRDFQAYLKKSEVNKENGKLGGRPAQKDVNDKPNLTQPNPEKGDTVTDTDTDTDTDTKESISIKSERFILPEWIPKNEWQGYCEMRIRSKKPMTDKAKKMAVTKLEEFLKQGKDLREILNQSIFNNYQGLFEVRNANSSGNFNANGGKSGNGRKSNTEQALDGIRAIAEKYGN